MHLSQRLSTTAHRVCILNIFEAITVRETTIPMRIPRDLSRGRGWLSLNANFFFTNKLQRERSILC